MKKLLSILLLPLLFVSSCEEEESQSGYDCISNTCSAVFESPQYLTLADCQSICEDNIGGNINLEIGDVYGGGIVFYIDGTGQHGLIAALENLEERFEWGCIGVSIQEPYNIVIGTGLQNTLDIVTECSESPIAASEALAYESGGYSDWYLPSKLEFAEMWNTIGPGSVGGDIGGFGSFCRYWTSSEHTDNYAWSQADCGDWGYYTKSIENEVRVIRAF